VEEAARRAKERGDALEAGQRDWERLDMVPVYRRNLNIQRPKLNYSYVIHPTSESSM
jgi:hypothetical protein